MDKEYSNNSNHNIHIKDFDKFYTKSLDQRQSILKNSFNLSDEDISSINSLLSDTLSSFTENSIGTIPIPLGVATNFLINETNYIVPLATEESSVVAAANFGAKIVKENGGFISSYSGSIMQGQVQIKTKSIDKNKIKKELEEIDSILKKDLSSLIKELNDTVPNLVKRGGGVLSFDTYTIEEISSLIIMIDVDVKEAFGANIIDTLCERFGDILKEKYGFDIGLRILTNLCLKRIASSQCKIKVETLDHKNYKGKDIAKGIVDAYRFAYYDINRAITHNKGIMNGIDAFTIATGNDFRAIEAAAHTYASLSGRYLPLSKWSLDDEGKYLLGSLTLPISLGSVGGIITVHPSVKTNFKILSNPSSSILSQIAVSVGLAQNLAALRALVSEGIQSGHMKLHKIKLK